MNSETNNLTQGGILKKLLTVALPVMGTQFMQMAYNLTDMFWLGRLGSGSVAASGTVGMYLWLSMAFLTLGRIGAEIGVSQSLGRNEPEKARSYAHTSLALAVVLGIAFAAIMMLFREPLIGFFGIREAHVVTEAQIYLFLVSPGIPFAFLSAAISGCFSASGNTRIPFYINAIGLVTNIVLDPVFIFTMGLGIAGAGILTALVQMMVCVLLVCAFKLSKDRPFNEFTLLKRPDLSILPQIMRWGIPISLESLLFTLLSMIISRLVSAYGASALAVMRVGSQIESLSWLISSGYATALTAFVGQNYGAGKWSRIHRGLYLSIGAMSVWGLFVTVFLILGARTVFTAFLPQPDIVEMGVQYLHILAACQIAGCIEFTTAGCFRGMGRTLPPSVASIASNAARVVLAYILAALFGLNGIWWAISIGAIGRGLWMFLWYCAVARNLPKLDEPVTQ